jgi:hypothetical protein
MHPRTAIGTMIATVIGTNDDRDQLDHGSWLALRDSALHLIRGDLKFAHRRYQGTPSGVPWDTGVVDTHHWSRALESWTPITGVVDITGVADIHRPELHSRWVSQLCARQLCARIKEATD